MWTKERYAISGEYASNGFTFRSEYVHSTGKAFAKTMTDTNDASASDCNLSAIGSKADGFLRSWHCACGKEQSEH